MVFWLRPNVTRERELFEKILADVAPGTPYLGWFADDIAGEFSGVELASSHGVYVLAADWFNNMTVFSGTRYKGAPDRPETTVRPLENKIYVTFIFGEGDNLQYNQHHMRVLWDDPNRGKVPINWTSSPLLIDAAPAILNYYHATATENDLLIAGPSGVGYFYGNVWPSDSFAEFLAAGAPYLERSGMPLVYALNRINEQNVRLTPQVARAYEEQYGLPGLFLSWESQYNTYLMEPDAAGLDGAGRRQRAGSPDGFGGGEGPLDRRPALVHRRGSSGVELAADRCTAHREPARPRVRGSAGRGVLGLAPGIVPSASTREVRCSLS